MKKTLRIAQWSQLNCIYLPLYIAIEEGLLARQFTDIQLIPTGNDDDIFNAVKSGKADIGIGDPTFCVMPARRKQGQKNKTLIIADICSRVALWGITHSPIIHEIKIEKDLVGLRLGCFPAPSTSHTILQASKENNKRLLKSMQIIEAPIGQQSDLLFADKADIALYIEPFISIAEERGWRVVYKPSEIYKDYSFTALYSSEKFINDNADIIKHLQDAIQKALDILHTSPDTAVQIAQNLFPELKPSILKNAVRRCLKDKIWPKTIHPSPEGWHNALQTRKDAGYTISPDSREINDIAYKA